MSYLKLFSGTNSHYLAEKIAAAYGKPLGSTTISRFSDGEIHVSFDESVREIIARTQLDRHPFHLDLSQPTPGEQQRWIIVEQHAATNRPVAKTN